MTQEAIAVRVGRSRSAIANTLRLLTLPAEIQESLARNQITAGHARANLGLEDAEEQRSLWRRILEASLTVRDAEALARRGKGSVRPRARQNAPPRPSADLAAVEEQLRAAVGTRVEVVRGAAGGRITIHFFSDEEFESIVERLVRE
jgi:ParB family chromosome partitioning protein